MVQDPAVSFNRLLARGRLRHLQLLAALADAGSVQRASAAVGMSQPAATQALADLEALLGAELFERHTRGVRLTRFGDAVVPVARNILHALRASAETLSALQAGAQAYLRLGCIPAVASGLLARALPALVKTQPGLQVELIEENTVHLLPELAAGRLDAVFCRRQHDVPAHWRFELLMRDEPVVVAAPAHPLASKRSIALKEVAALPWILPPRGMGVREYFEHLWSAEPSRPVLHPVATTSLSVVLEVLHSGDAVSLMPRSIAKFMVEMGGAAILRVRLAPSLDSSLEGLGLLTTGLADPPPLKELRARLRGTADR